MRVSNEKRGVIKLEEIQADLAAFKAEHAGEADPKRYHVFLIDVDFFTPLEFKQDMQAMGMAYNQRHKCWYWHNRLGNPEFTHIQDDALIRAVKYPATGRYFDFG